MKLDLLVPGQVKPPSSATPVAASSADVGATTPSPASSSAPDERSTTFKPVAGAPEVQSGERLLVEAYSVLWVILFVFLFFTLRRQRGIDARVTDLEAQLKRARSDAKAGDG